MKQLKKTLLTLVALLALTTQAWATDVYLVGNGTGNWLNGAIWDPGVAGNKMTEQNGVYSITFTNVAANSELPLQFKFAINGTWDVTYGCSTDTENELNKTLSNIDASGGNNILFRLTEAADVTISFNLSEMTYMISTKGMKVGDDATSGPEVAWNKAEKTGTFTMPGGNVTLEPEYYPQAALTAAPSAINDVPATTDGAIVNAGTVANIGETTNAQGTVMYYVSQTALDDDALLALAADQWTADVPTAQSLAQGQAYVYYYVRGNDSDNDEENFSDGDILAANKLPVTIAAEPTYAVTFAEGTDPNEWKAEPAAGVKKGTDVTVTYNGKKKVIGVKAEKKAAESLIVNPEVGQYIGSDGKNYDADATLPDGVTKVAMITYVGNDAETSTTYNHGLALALEDVSGKKAWCSQKDATCLPTQYSTAATAKGDMAGIANTDALVNHTGHTHAAASAARNYNSGIHPAGTSAWFLPSAGQWDKMANAAGDYATLRDNAGLNEDDLYLSSTEYNANFVWDFNVNYGDWGRTNKDYDSDRVRACLAF